MFNKIGYGAIVLLSYLPWWFMYGLSNVLKFFLFSVAKYREDVIVKNLTDSFPEKTKDEIHAIKRGFQSHFCDIIVESIKMFSISEKELNKRMKTINPEVPDKYFDKGTGIIFVGGHYNNWEIYGVNSSREIKHDTVALYTPLSNKFFDQKMKSSRSRFGMRMVDNRYIGKYLTEEGSNRDALIFGADQSPSKPEKSVWIRFLNQPTPVFFGVEKYAKEMGYPVFFGSIQKVKRGHYTIEYTLLTDDPKSMPHQEITYLHSKRLEEDIIRDPRYWLWSHKRWKIRHLAPDKLYKE